jgi:hypothetical protein
VRPKGGHGACDMALTKPQTNWANVGPLPFLDGSWLVMRVATSVTREKLPTGL